jgi:hypothetical protein
MASFPFLSVCPTQVHFCIFLFCLQLSQLLEHFLNHRWPLYLLGEGVVTSDRIIRCMTKELWFNPCKRQEIFLFSKLSTLTLDPTQSPVQGILWALSLLVKLGTHLHPVLGSGMSGAIPPLPWRLSCHMKGQLIFTALYSQNRIKKIWWHQYGPLQTSQHTSEESVQHKVHSLQVLVVCICIFFKS